MHPLIAPLPCRHCGGEPTFLLEMTGQIVVAHKYSCAGGCVGGTVRAEYRDPRTLSPREILRQRRAGRWKEPKQVRAALLRRWNVFNAPR